jgi:hypothetical protein
MNKFLAVALLLPTLLLGDAGATFASSRTLRGRIVDEDGLPVGAAQVTIKSPSGQTTVLFTEPTGTFSLAGVAPGDYELRIEKIDFFVLDTQKISLAGDSAEFTFTLTHQDELHEQINVMASPHTLDPEEIPQTSTLTNTELRDIPVPSSHNLQQSLIALPEILRDNLNLIHVAGARNTQAQYLLDGVEVGDSVSNAFSVRLSVDAVRSVEVHAGRFGAEYAHPGAAILNFDTPEGDDRWRYAITDFIPGLNTKDGLQLGNYYPRVYFSGPIVKDHFWFSQAFTLQHTLAFVDGLPAGENTRRAWRGDSLSHLLWRLASNDSLHIAFLDSDESDTSVGLDALHPQSTSTDVSTNRIFGYVKNQFLQENTLLETGFSVDRSLVDSNRQGVGTYVLMVNGAAGNFFQDFEQKGRRYQLFADVIRASLHWHGTHTLSGGGNLSEVQLIQTANRGEIRALRSDLTLSRVTAFTGNANFQISNALAGGFLQDAWNLNHYLIFETGLRADWDRYIQAAMVEPRISANLLPFRDGRGKFSIGWGLYDIPLNLSVIGQTYDQRQVDTLYDRSGITPVAGPTTSRFAQATSGLQKPYFSIASAGWQQRFGERTLISVELLARNEHHGLVFVPQNPGQIGGIFLLQTSRRDKYRGATFTTRRTFTNGAVVFGSYTRSRASTDQLLDPLLGSLYFAPQQGGPLLWDAPNRFLSWGSIPTPIWGILFSYLFEYRTGYPFDVVDQRQLLIGAPSSRRFPDYANLTIGLEKKFRFRGYLFAGRISVINILGRENPDTVVNNIDAINTTPSFLTFSGGQSRAVTARLRFLGRK